MTNKSSFGIRIWTPLFVLAWLLLAQCAKEIIIDLPEEQPRLVVVCHFTDGEQFRAKFSLSKPVNDGSKPVIFKDVDATLAINGDFWARFKPDTTIKDKIAYWESPQSKLASAGVEYSFTLRVAGYPNVQATSSIPHKIPLQHVVLGASDVSVVPLGNGLQELRIPLELRLPYLPVTGRYFAFNLTHETYVYESFNPPIIDNIQEGRTNFLTDGRTFSLLHDIPEPIVLVNENFWADNRRSLYLVARIPFDPDSERPQRIFVEWRTLSEEFYRYHLSLSRQGNNVPFSEPDAVFNNIQGGYGNFSGYSVSMDTVLIPNF